MNTLDGEEVTVEALAPLVKDAARCRLVVEGDPTIADEPIIEQIEKSGLTIHENELHQPSVRRGFRHRKTGEPIDIGSGNRYLDTKVTVTEVPTRDGEVVLCEIAIVTPEMVVATVAEHPVYEIIRSLDTEEELPAEPSHVPDMICVKVSQMCHHGKVDRVFA